MTGAEARLDEEGLSLWLTNWTTSVGGAWSGRRILALVGGKLAGQLDYLVHPDEQALSVMWLEVQPAYQGRNLASVMADALCAAHPTAWIDPGARTTEGARWWDRYSAPDPQRNIHNRPMHEWARYFDATEVSAHKAQNALLNRLNGLNGHPDAVDSYVESLESEALQNAKLLQTPSPNGPDPASTALYGGMPLRLRPVLHRLVHHSSHEPAERARMLLEHVGHGNLPHESAWHTTERAAFEDIARAELFYPPSGTQPATYLTFRLLPMKDSTAADRDVKSTWVAFPRSPGIPVQLAGMSWRTTEHPWLTHRVDFATPVDAAIEPHSWHNSSPEYRARYNLLGEQHPVPGAPQTFAGFEDEIRRMADRLAGDSARRNNSAPASGPRSVPHPSQPHQPPTPRPPRPLGP